MDVTKIIEENPALVMGVIAVAVLVMVMRSGTSTSVSAGQMVNAQLKAMEIASKTNVELSGQNAKSAAIRTQTLGEAYTTSVKTTAQLAATRDTNAVRAQIAAGDQSVRSQQINASKDVSMYSIKNTSDLQAQKLNNDLETMNRFVTLQQYGIDVTAANLPQILHSREVVSAQNAQTAQAIAALNTEAARTGASSQASSSSSSNALGWVSTIASLFF